MVRTDITERSLAGEHAQQANERLVDAIESLQEAFALFDTEDRLVLCNDGYRRLCGAVQDKIVPGIKFEEILRAYTIKRPLSR